MRFPRPIRLEEPPLERLLATDHKNLGPNTQHLTPSNYSLLNDRFGSTLLARSAGTSDATTDTTNNTPAPNEKT